MDALDTVCDFWAGSPPRLCATSPVPVGVDTLSRKTSLRETRGCRVAQLEHNISDDKDIWSSIVEGSKWMGVSAFHLSVAVTPLVMRTGKGIETGTSYSKPFVQPKRQPRDVSWIHPPSRTWGETETRQAHWNWDEHQKQEMKHDYRAWNSNQTVQPKQSLEPGVESARRMKATVELRMMTCRTTLNATVRPVTLPEGWTLVSNSLRQVMYCLVKSGIAGFRKLENPELLDGLKFEKGSNSGSGRFEPETSLRLQAQTWQSSRAQQIEDLS